LIKTLGGFNIKLLISVGHPAHVHFFKNLIWNLEKKGHIVKIVARDKDVVLKLLDSYGFNYEVISSKGNNLIDLGIELLKRHFKLFKIVRDFKPNLIFSGFDPSVAQVGRILHVPTIVFADNRPDVTKFPPIGPMVIPFVDTVLTLSTVEYDFGSKGIKMDGYKELAYLHPNIFKPDPMVIQEAGLSKDEEFALVRFVGLGAYHDIGGSGFDFDTKMELIQEIGAQVPVFISSESKLPEQLEKYKLPVSPEKIHDLIYYSKLLICDSQTMATEAAVLGTPAIRCNSFVGTKDMENFKELEQKYGLIFNYNDPEKAINKALELLTVPNLKDEWSIKRKQMLQDKIDVTAFMTWLVENYLDRVHNMKLDPTIQRQFRSVVE
jgi:Uncharacterized protein conserved in archaea